MIEIKYLENETEYELTIQGHSGYADYGKDIVCASVSILVHSFCESLLEAQEWKILSVDEMYIADGDVRIKYRDTFGYTTPIIKMIRIAFESLAEEYSDYCKCEWGRIPV